MHILVTGHAGFIGSHVAQRLLQRGDSVVGFDLVAGSADSALKEDRLRRLEDVARTLADPAAYRSVRGDLADAAAVDALFAAAPFDRVIHLAARAGVRESLRDPRSYVHSNLAGFLNVLESCRQHRVAHLTYASSSSVYGANTTLPASEALPADHPVQFYAASKRANELMAHAWSHLYGLPTTGLRFFTVYGPWGRQDMAMHLFTQRILERQPIAVYGHGRQTRDFTYVDDIVDGVLRTSDRPAEADPQWDGRAPASDRSAAPWRVYNIGHGQPVPLLRYIEAIEAATGLVAEKQWLPMQPGDVPDTHADVERLRRDFGWQPTTPIEVGVGRYVEWHRAYYGL